MKYPRRVVKWILTVTFLAGFSTAASAQITLESLLGEMTDLTALTRFPDPAYTVKQFSSYDRRSQHADVHTVEDWFANGDRGQFLRTEERNSATEWVMIDAEGPGAIVRIWSANPVDAGIVRVYLDGNTRPTIEMPFTDMLGGHKAPFIEPIAGIRSSGWNSYLPIPYAKYCRVTASKPDFYYQINYRTYDPDADVETYSPEIAEETMAQVRTVAEWLANPIMKSQSSEHRDTRAITFALNPGTEQEEVISSEDTAIYAFTATVQSEDIATALRQCVLCFTFDGTNVPQVCTPLGDFFATAPGLNTFTSLPLAVGDDGQMTSAWVMPFQRSAQIQIVNTGVNPVTIDTTIGTGAYSWTDQSLYFHANWRGEYPIPTRPRQDWTFLKVEGRGRFVGDMLHVMNPLQLWWGEGDEKIYVDDESFPSDFGTGTEDYYGYAWCSPALFTHAYHNQSRCDGPGNYGNTCVSRFHILDNIPFTKAFKFDMEVWHAWECDIAMAATSYWYARPGATSTPSIIDPADLVIVTPPPLPKPKKVEEALEAEALEVVKQTAGKMVTENQPAFGWSNGKQIRWFDGEPGDSISFGFSVEDAGRYEVRAVFTKATRYGIMRFTVNGQSVGGEYDMYSPSVEITKEATLGVFDLKEGQNLLTVEVAGANPKAGHGHMFGLDYLILERMP